jgi:hypothetical protein
MLDNLALFAIYVVVVNLIGLAVVHRRSYGLDGWPDAQYRAAAQV